MFMSILLSETWLFFQTQVSGFINLLNNVLINNLKRPLITTSFKNKKRANNKTPLPKSMKIDTVKGKKHSIDRIMKFTSHDFFSAIYFCEVIKIVNQWCQNVFRNFIPFNLFVC